MAPSSFILLFFDALFFSGIYLALAFTLERPPLLVTASILFLLFAGAFWYFRLYRIEVYLERQRNLARLFNSLAVVFILFWAAWWFLLKTEWPLASRLLHLMVIPTFGIFYALLLRSSLALFLLRFLPVHTLLNERDQAVFSSRWAKLLPRSRTLAAADEITALHSGFLFWSYSPAAEVKNRADMWGDYLKQLTVLREQLADGKVIVFAFNPYNEELQGAFSLLHLDETPALELRPGRRDLYRLAGKRILDLLAGVILFPFFLILHPLIFILVSCSFGRPVIFRQQRIGRQGKTFALFKYRTMDIVSGKKTTEIDKTHFDFIRQLLEEEAQVPFIDQRISAVGRRVRKLRQREEFSPIGTLLRKTSLDELPQIFNILAGQMSLVGPRPALPYEVALYPEWASLRFQAPQGLTGLWQSSGRGLMPLHTALFLDCYYALERSFWLDLFTLFKTARSLWDFTKIY